MLPTRQGDLSVRVAQDFETRKAPLDRISCHGGPAAFPRFDVPHPAPGTGLTVYDENIFMKKIERTLNLDTSWEKRVLLDG